MTSDARAKFLSTLIVRAVIPTAMLMAVAMRHVVVGGAQGGRHADQSSGQASTASKSKGNEGERLFRKETFGGNGRTCETCHSPSTGTLSPDDVRERLRDPTDPLFLHDGASTTASLALRG